MKKFMALILLIAIMIPVVAYASEPKHFGAFCFSDVTATQDTGYRAKSDYDNKWYMTLLSPSNVSTANVPGAKPRIYDSGVEAGGYEMDQGRSTRKEVFRQDENADV